MTYNDIITKISEFSLSEQINLANFIISEIKSKKEKINKEVEDLKVRVDSI